MAWTRILIAFALLSSLAPAAEYFVPDDFPTIQDAISSGLVVNGDTVTVRPGTYVENIDFLGKAITVRSEQGPAKTTIDGNQAGSVVAFQSGEGPDSVLQGFTITNGTGTEYGYETFIGGGIYGLQAAPTIGQNIIKDNAVAMNGLGGGIGFHLDSAPTIIFNTVEDNSASFHGGGIYVEADDSFGGYQATIDTNTIRMNQANKNGGGIFFCGMTVEVINNTLEQNVAGSGLGGGIYCKETDGTIEGNSLSDNSATCGGGIAACSDAWPVISNNMLNGNVAIDRGGGIYLEDDPHTVRVLNNVLVYNLAITDGGGIAGWNLGTAIVMNNLFNYNVATEPVGKGGGLYFGNTGAPQIINNTVVNNSAGTGGGFACEGLCNPSVWNTIFWDNSAPLGKEIAVIKDGAGDPSYLIIHHCDLKGGPASVYKQLGCFLDWGDGMIDADPLWVDPMHGDYHLQQDPCQPGVTNPCVDTGFNYGLNWGLAKCTTRTDGVYDFNVLDMGFHYGESFLPALVADGYEIPENAGAKIRFLMTAGHENSGYPFHRQYILLATASGTSPGYTLPGGLATLPLNWDWLTDIVLQMINTPVFHKFMGTLEFYYGSADALLYTGPLPGAAGLVMHFAYALNKPWDYASNTVRIEIVP
ncbi:MAG: right-handed parallel beta-helix repeat-containing protein [Planctomycetota bacterium]